MFPIPYKRPAGIHVALVIVFGVIEFGFLGNGIPIDEKCVNVSGEVICYFKGSQEAVEWERARQLCNSSNSMLLVIRNKDDQAAVASYLKSHIMRNSSAWTSGKNLAHSEWTWINGEPLAEHGRAKFQGHQGGEQEILYASLEANSSLESNSSLEPEFLFQAHAWHHEIPYICQYKDVPCDRSSELSVLDGCFKLSDVNRTWYNARNQCLMTGGDLAVISDNVYAILKQRILHHQYWVGLRKESWRWIRNDKDESIHEIKYTKWDNKYATNGECISIDAPNGTWKALGCGERKSVVCQKVFVLGQGEPFTTTTQNIQTIMDSVTSVSEESTTSTTGGSQNSQSLPVGAGILIIIICIIIIIIFALRSTKKSPKQIGQPKSNNSSSGNNLEEFENNPSNMPASTSANVPIHGVDDIRGVYADIPLSAVNQLEEEATNQQPGIVYASVEFQKEPIYQEPNKKRDDAASPTKVGPLGDIYAMPGVKGESVASPAGNSSSESNSHPVKVTAQGDVYALPVKDPKSPTANPSGGVVYANLQTY